MFKLLFNMKTKLLIDSASNKEIKVGIRIDKKEYEMRKKIGYQKAQVVLPMIDKLLRQYVIGIRNLTSIQVNTGHGSFTGIRVGMSIANALSFALKIPVRFEK